MTVEQQRMSVEELREALTTVTSRLAAYAAEDVEKAADPKNSECMQALYRGRASGYQLSLDSINVWTHGEFGVSAVER